MNAKVLLSVSLTAACFVYAAGATLAEELDPRLKEFDISGLVRFETPQQAEAVRQRMVRFIWPNGLPATRPTVVPLDGHPAELAAVDRSLVSKVERYDVDVSGFDFIQHSFAVFPKQPAEGAPRLAVVHGGHMPEGPENYLIGGLDDTIEVLLKQGYVVAVVQMPLVTWNDDTDGVLPSGTRFEVKGRATRGHDQLMAVTEPELEGAFLRFFLEEVVQVTNELLATHEDPEIVLMIGLSGGGWTTHLSAAVDPRIDVSIPVAGSLPLYARPFSPGSKGDAEQEYAKLYREEDTDGDGVLDKASGIASWLEIYALGGTSPDPKRPRLEVQVLNLYDTCCFGGTVYKTYGQSLTDRVAAIDTGRWSVYSDDSHRGHAISPVVIRKVLPKAIKEWKQLQEQQ
ncbi:hypothetical protein [Aeoliella sp.]|uniref:hypothetical protein n=1 Tax=Aeoliella sp. TaxID=2795800 RepID=UPI003CCBA34B